MFELIKREFESAADKLLFIEQLRDFIHKELSPNQSQPIDRVRWVPIEKVKPNDYNPNSVAGTEMRLLYVSIKADGYTQPVVTVYDAEQDQYVIVDGFHRYFTMQNNRDIYEQNNGLLPVVVINSHINDRMASTVRHNRARGKHSVTGMSNMVFCLNPDTRLLTSDLRWKPIEKINIGDELIGFDEILGSKNKMRRTIVTGISQQVAERVRVITDQGEIIASPNHQWVTVRGKRTDRIWRRTDELKTDDRICQFCTPWNAPSSYDDGWMAGFLDGEGYIHQKTSIVGFGQNPGETLNRALSILTRDGFRYSVHAKKKCVEVRILNDFLRVIGYYRPTRLLPKAHWLWEGKRSWGKTTGCATVIRIERISNGDVCGLSTSTGTIIAEGMLSHNSMLDNGWEDARICNELGMEAEELLKLKHITGFSKLFKDKEYQKSWETKRQIELRRDYQEPSGSVEG
jgi:ParB-like nuclease domain